MSVVRVEYNGEFYTVDDGALEPWSGVSDDITLEVEYGYIELKFGEESCIDGVGGGVLLNANDTRFIIDRLKELLKEID